LQAGLQTAIAEADGSRQTRTRILRGARDEEKKIASDKDGSARATFEEAKSRLEMQRALYQREQVSRASYEQAVRDLGSQMPTSGRCSNRGVPCRPSIAGRKGAS